MDFKKALKEIRKKLILLVDFSIETIKFCVLFPFAHRYRKRDIWIVAERGTEARDNGYHMFKYIRAHDPSREVYYVIDKDSPDRKKVEPYGNVIDYGSVKHYLIFIAASIRISTHIMGFSPNRNYYTTLMKKVPLRGKTVFLQHGVIYSDLKQLYAENTNVDIFICGAKPEFDYVKATYGYQNNEVKYTGLARYDNLYDCRVKPQILIMPTWRRALVDLEKKGYSIENTDYVRHWNGLLNDPRLIEAAESRQIEIVFYPHYELQKHIHLFSSSSKNVIIADFEHYDVQQLLKESALLITDSSSVHFDFAYMKKPCLYYQFDAEEFYAHHYAKGYFDHHTMGFGEVTDNQEELVALVTGYMENGFRAKEEYQQRCEAFFPLHDQNNCRRIYDEIIQLEDR